MCKTIKQKIKIKASPRVVYNLLVCAKEHQAFTGRKATNTKKIGGAFSSYGGAVSGLNVDLLPEKRVVQAWREHRFPDGVFSMATFTLAPTPDGGTELVLTHRGVPKDLIPRIEREWREHYWEKMRRFVSRK